MTGTGGALPVWFAVRRHRLLPWCAVLLVLVPLLLVLVPVMVRSVAVLRWRF